MGCGYYDCAHSDGYNTGDELDNIAALERHLSDLRLRHREHHAENLRTLTDRLMARVRTREDVQYVRTALDDQADQLGLRVEHVGAYDCGGYYGCDEEGDHSYYDCRGYYSCDPYGC